MRASLPSELAPGRERALLLYEARGAEDGSAALSHIISMRAPAALLDLESMLHTDLRTGQRHFAGKSCTDETGHIRVALDASEPQHHQLAFGSLSSALSYLHLRHPDLYVRVGTRG